MSTRVAPVIMLMVVFAACGGDPAPPAADVAAPSSTTTEPPASTLITTTTAPTTTSTTTPPTTTTVAETTATATTTATTTTTESPPVPIRIRFERRVDDAATETFAEVARGALTDPRGWEQGGFEFSFGDDAEYTVILAEGPEVDALCDPYTTRSRFSCQIGPIVALNADRWRGAVESWPGSLLEYQIMLVNHEVGHLLGQHHPAAFCTEDGEPAAVMAQQSSGVGTCLANSWPLEWEIACAARHEEPLAPPYEAKATPTCGPEG
jgi:hypothetical protein